MHLKNYVSQYLVIERNVPSSNTLCILKRVSCSIRQDSFPTINPVDSIDPLLYNAKEIHEAKISIEIQQTTMLYRKLMSAY